MVQKCNRLTPVLLCTGLKLHMDTVQLLGQIPDGKMPLLPKVNTQEKYGAITVGLVFVLMLITDTPMK